MKGHIAAVTALAALAACGGGGGGGEGGPPGAAFEIAYPGVTFDRPLIVRAAPGDDDRLYVAEQGGRIWVFDAREDVSAKSLFLDLTDRTLASGEQGLLGLAFDPDFTANGYVYVNYTANHNPDVSPGDSVTARFTADLATHTVARSTGVELLRLRNDPYPNHNGGAIEFGTDGRLYIGIGDGGSSDDPGNRSQDLSSPLGKILRIARNGSIPADNPFVDVPGARGEIWAYGLRNPFRISFDGDTLWAGDVGQDDWEEIDLIVKGGNYGWRKYEGSHVNFPGDPEPEDPIPPVFEYGHDEGCSITGGRVYRGSRVPSLDGKYVYGDFCSGTIWALTVPGGTSNVRLGTIESPSSFGEDVDGELLVTSFDGQLHRLVP